MCQSVETTSTRRTPVGVVLAGSAEATHCAILSIDHLWQSFRWTTVFATFSMESSQAGHVVRLEPYAQEWL
jgi:hypothetical protein